MYFGLSIAGGTKNIGIFKQSDDEQSRLACDGVSFQLSATCAIYFRMWISALIQ